MLKQGTLGLFVVGTIVLAGLLLSGAAAKPEQQAGTGSSRTVFDFGAAGDGQTDDTAAIQKAVDAGNGSVRFAKGIYRITKPIVIDLDKVGYTSIEGDGAATILMAGAGPAFRFVGTHAGTAAPSTVKQNVWDRQRTPAVDGIEIVGGHPEASGIEASGTMQLTLTRVVVREALHGVHLVERNRNVILSECHLYHNKGIGVFLDRLNLHQINIANCHISYNAGGGVVVRQSEVRNLQIGTCDIEGKHGRRRLRTDGECALGFHGKFRGRGRDCGLHDSARPRIAELGEHPHRQQLVGTFPSPTNFGTGTSRSPTMCFPTCR